jgi:toxin YhaV
VPRTEYLLRYHELYAGRISELKERVRELKARLSPEEFARHETVKLAVRLREAEKEIAEDPDRRDYLLREELRKFRRYKKGLGRFRLLFCFSRKPPIIIFLYVNTADSLRKDGSRNDPYEQFKALLRRGEVSSDPADPRLGRWLKSVNPG